jgi:hypothetical protein
MFLATNQKKCFDDKISKGEASLGSEISLISVEASKVRQNYVPFAVGNSLRWNGRIAYIVK